jgi:hypothetical protein
MAGRCVLVGAGWRGWRMRGARALLHAARLPAPLDVLRVAPRVASGVRHAALADGARDGQAQERVGDEAAVAAQIPGRWDDRGAGEEVLRAEDCVVCAGGRDADGGGGSPGACKGVAGSATSLAHDTPNRAAVRVLFA